MNQLVEYCQRRKIEFLWAANDGVVFLNDHNRPAIICLTSSFPRQITSCSHCKKTSAEIAVECISPNRDAVYCIDSHEHLPSDTDLFPYLKKTNGDYKPYKAKSQSDVEIWLWQFFIIHNKLKYSSAWRSFCSEQTSRDYKRHIEQMAWCAYNHSKLYTAYYEMYQNLVAGRSYLLFG